MDTYASCLEFDHAETGKPMYNPAIVYQGKLYVLEIKGCPKPEDATELAQQVVDAIHSFTRICLKNFQFKEHVP
jgi:hypothetical protein